MGDTHEIRLRNDHAELPRLAQELEEFLERHAVSPDVLFKVNLVLDELVTNIIHYGFDDGQEHIITISLDFDGGTLRLELEDDGKAFNPLDAPEPDLDATLEDREVGGLGVHFMREIMDKVEYRRDGNRNILTMQRTSEA